MAHFKRIFTLEIGKQRVGVGFGNPGNDSVALYDPAKQRIILRRSLLKDLPELKRTLRHESVHVVVSQIEEMLAESLEGAIDRADAALNTYLQEHPEVLNE